MADKRFSLTFDASMNIQQISHALQKVQAGFNNLDISSAGQKSFIKLFSNLEEAIKDFETKAGKEITNMGDFKNLEKSLQKITNIYDRLRTEIKTTANLSDSEILKMFPNTLDDSFKDATKSLEQFKAKMKSVADEVKKVQTERDKQERKRDAAQRKDATKGKKVVSSGQMADLKAERAAIKKQREEAIAERERLERELQKRIEENSLRIKKDGTADKRYGDKGSNQQLLDDLKAARTLADNLEASFENIEGSIKSSISQADVAKNLQQFQQEAQEAQREIDVLDQKIASLQADPELAQVFQELIEVIQKLTGADLTGLNVGVDGIKEIQTALNNFESKKIEEAREAMRDLGTASEKVGKAIDGADQEMEEFGNTVDETNRRARDIDNLANSIKDFFSITNTVQLLKNAVKDAFDTVKELDAAMTETAVVTDFSIGDMWDQLPRYTSMANKLGTTTLGAYETMTLFYQQGLKTNEVFEIGGETMKMARIAGMDYADATDKMTAALRGFNMELNTTSAQRVNDVYSELAAITAADTNEIATAMTKTASIADSANMEFETTAAFLSQIIETTRESAETAGTAMKTVIARFQELKKDPAEIGEVDGEIVDANKIEGALRTIGVALRDTNGQFRDLDDVFLDIAKRWDGLDTNTQRYIATMAAGSRQQSRFIAMMSNYDRTMELVNAATNSAGSSQRQFEKTTESLESKLNRLSNAWDSFTMGLANSEVIKFFVDLLTGLITTINNLTDLLPGAGSGIAKLLLTIGSLKAGAAIFDGFFTNLRKTGTEAMGPIQALGKAVKTSFSDMGSTTGFSKIIEGFQKLSGGNGIKGATQALFGFNAANKVTIASMTGATTATTGFSAALAACPIGWIVAGIAAVVAIVWGLVKAWQAASDAFKMQQINKSIDEMTDQIDGAKEAIDRLEDSRTTLRNLQSEFANLAEGTAEWKEKLVGVNQQVLDIIEKYPELSKYVTRTSQGTLDIKDEGWDALYKSQNALIQNASYAKMGMQYARTDLQEKMDFEEQITSALGESFGESIDGEAFGRNVGTAIGTTIGGIGMGLAGSVAGPVGTGAGIIVGGVAGGEVGGAIGAEIGAKYEENIQESFADISEWANQATLDVAGFLDTDWGKVAGIGAATASAAGIGALIGGPIGAAIGAGVGLVGGAIGLIGDKDFEEKAQSKMTGGLNQNEFAKFLTELGDAQITFDEVTGEFSDPAAAKKIFDSLGFEASFEDVAAQAKKLGGSFNELIVSAQKYSQAKEAEKDALISNAITNSAVGEKEYADALGNILGETKYADIEPMLEEKKNGLTNNKKELKELYAKTVGGHYENGKLYSDGTMTTEWDLSKETMKAAIASAQLAQEMGTAAEDLSTVISDLAPQQQELFAELFSSDGALIEDQTYFDLMKKGAAAQGEGGSISADWIAQELGFENISQMAESLGMEVSQVGEILSTNLGAARTRITNARKATVKSMSKYGKDNISFDKHAQDLAKMEETYGPIFNQYLSSMFEAVSKAGDDALTSAAFNEYMKIAATGNENSLAQANKIIHSIDWSNPIQAVSSLNEQLNSGSAEARSMAKALLQAGQEAFSSGKQMQYFVQSSAFEGIKEEIAGVVESQGELSADNILEMADGCSDLKKMMKQTGISAAGLAKALTKFEEGEWTINQLTNAVLAAIGNFNSLDSVVAETLKTLSEFDPGMDENEVAEFVSTYYDVLNENLEKGAVGNSQSRNILSFLFGDDWDDGLSKDALVAKMQQLRDFMGENTEDMRASWAGLAAGVTPEGGVVNQSALGSVKIQDNGNNISLTGFEGMTTEELVGRISEAYDVSKEYAQMMLTDLKNYSVDLAEELNANDYNAGLKKAYDELEHIKQINWNSENMRSRDATYTKVIDESEIKAIADAYGKAYEEVASYFTGKGALITDFYDDEGLLIQSNELMAELERIFTTDAGKAAGAKWYAGFTAVTPDGKTIIDYEGMMGALGQLNLPEEAKASIASDITESIRNGSSDETIYLDYEFSDGVTRTIEVPANIDVQTAIANAEQELKDTKLGEAIANAFGNVEVNVTTNESGLAEVTTAITTAVGNANTDLSPTVTEEAKAQISSDINSAVTSMVYMAPIDANTSAMDARLRKYVVPSKQMLVYEKIVPAKEHAKGIKNSPDSHTALIGEAGPEIHQTQDGAYLASGPQLAHIEKGDTVYTAQETREILKDKGTKVPRYATGYNTEYGYSGGNKPGTETNEEDVELWENSFDKLYNLVRDIDEEVRRRERMERRYEQLLEDGNATAKDLYDATVAQLEQLEHERNLNEELVNSRSAQIDAYQNENSEFQKYGQVVTDETGNRVLRINWDQINEVKDSEQGEKIEEYISQLEEWVDDIDAAEEALWEIEDAIEEIKERGKEQYLDLEEKVKTALLEQYQSEIDTLNTINDSINDSNAQLIDAINSQISKLRQDRKNDKAETSIEEKQRQLMYLSQDTSGANDLKIMELQKEIDNETETHLDSLIDQKIDELESQNDQAALQRELQIQTAEAQLKQLEESGKIWNRVQTLLDEGLDRDTGLVRGSQLEDLLKSAEGYEGMSKTQQMEWLKDLESSASQAAAYLKGLEEGFESEKQVSHGDSSNFGPITPEPDPAPKNTGSGGDGGGGGGGGGGNTSGSGYTKNPGYSKTEIKSLQKKAGITVDGIWGPQTAAAYDRGVRPDKNADLTTNAAREEKFEIKSMTIDDAKEKKKWKIHTLNGTYITTFEGTYQEAQKSFPAISYKITGPFKTGGLADFTGPAWLDGTKSRPEYVLNADQTRGFLHLVDILDSINRIGTTPAQNSGDSSYDIDINVESIGSDYDVEQLAAKIKKMINSDARYRNNNAISLKR